MPSHPLPPIASVLVAASLMAGCASSHDAASMHAGQGGAHAGHGAAMPSDTRTPVHFPPMLRAHTLANMRDHLAALAEIQQALADGRSDAAAEVAERRLGMSSLHDHGAHEVAGFMPPAMQAAGTAMHRSASRLAVVARDAGATGDILPAQAALAALTQTCVACHAGFRLE
ncbi:hypothetical protein [Rubrivivax albus]|uniref:Cytochrome c n=1 Tax=Rubrivivax albus TaxID=2499835 RepID=A0A3S2U2Z6_9BURK|nr:hypothetical protein [Rubrivivax albus]RVT51537.1 hypothetical protein ENE75_12000 [Rubrivivax albus]